jgi:two-component system, cell cycle sensor histidine kinase and response regulator CckA
LAHWLLIVYLLFTVAGATLVAALALYAWTHRSAAGASAFAMLMSAVSLWAFIVVVELLSPSNEAVLLLVKIEYVFIASIPPSLLVYALSYSGYGQRLGLARAAAMALVPITTVVLMWTNDHHGLIWQSYSFVRDGAFLLQDVSYGIWFWVNSAYAYLMMGAAFVVLAVRAASVAHIYRRQATAILLGVSFPWVANLIYVFRLSPVEHLDLTPLSFVVGGLVMAWAMFRYRLLDLAPVARDKLIENIRDSMFVIDGAGRISDVNRAALNLLGVSGNEILGRSAHEALAFWEELESTVLSVGRTGMSLNTSLSVPHGNRHYDVRISPLTSGAEGGDGLLLVLRDISAYRRAQDLQRALYQISEAASSSQDLQALFEQVHKTIGELIPAENLFIVLYDEATDTISCPYHVDAYDPVPQSGTMHDWGDTLTALLISSGEPLLIASETDRSTVRSLGVRTRGTPCCCWLGVPLRTGKGKTVGALVVQSYHEEDQYHEEDKAVLSFVSTQVAMAVERMRAAEALRINEEHFRSIFEGAGIGIAILVAGDGRFSEVNPAFSNWLGFSAAELRNMRWSDVTHPDFFDKSVEDWQWLLSNGAMVGNIEYRAQRKDGQTVWGLVTASTIEGPGAIPGSVVCMVQDTTPLRLAEEERQSLLAQYLQAQKMEAIGRLTAGIAHDFNNLLTVINGYAERVRMTLPLDDPLQESVGKIAQSGWRAAELIDQLLIFSRKGIAAPRSLNMNDAIGEIEKMLSRVIGEDIDLSVSLSTGLWLVELDPTQFEQIVFNLAVNARDAMPDGGGLTISTENCVMTATLAAEIGFGAAQEEYVVLTVQDTGAGMSEEIRKRVFEPFFTTKDEGKGTGLGLATVQEIVTQSHGFVQLESVEGEGTTFRVFIPRSRVQGRDGTDARAAEATTTAQGSETVLVVEDDRDMREVILHTLRDLGYTVLSAGSADEALKVSQEYSGEIHLVVADVILPDRNGLVLTEEINSLRQSTKLLLMSGYADEIVQQYGVVPKETAFLRKPFGPQGLAESVRSTLDRE